MMGFLAFQPHPANVLKSAGNWDAIPRALIDDDRLSPMPAMIVEPIVSQPR
jgi:hypothetical protein